MTDDDAYTAGVAEIKALRDRLRRLEEMAQAAAQPPADSPATFGDAINVLRTTGSASGSAVDSLRRQITARPEPATAPDPERLRDPTATTAADRLRRALSKEQ